MEAKLRQLMRHEGINSTRLAEMLGIQASGISHIMSGRNKPSFDFIHKLLQRFPQLNPDWLLLDKGPMYRDGIKSKNGQPLPVGADTRYETRLDIRPETPPAPSAYPTASPTPIASSARADYNTAGDPAPNNLNPETIINTPPEGLFAPDNNDIIPSAAGQALDRAIDQKDEKGTTRGQATERQAAGQSVQYPAYQHGALMKSTTIERIVVFYKDKTFSEYRPE